jgi:hypothetical protein
MTSPMLTDWAEFATAKTQPRMAGSTERNWLRTKISPAFSTGGSWLDAEMLALRNAVRTGGEDDEAGGGH